MKLNLLDKNGKVISTKEVSDELFGAKPKDALVAQYVKVYQSNQRQGTSSTKGRGEVSGGGRKPWRQKGLGKARHGSIRSPLWRTGGIVHGPKPKSWSKNLNKKMRKVALASVLSTKVSKNDLFLLENIDLRKPNTKKFREILEATNGLDRRTLIVLDKNDMNIRKSVSNIKGVETALVENLNTYEVLLAKKVIFMEKAVEILEQRYIPSNDKKESTKKTKK